MVIEYTEPSCLENRIEMLYNRDSRYLASKAISENGYDKVSFETYESY